MHRPQIFLPTVPSASRPFPSHWGRSIALLLLFCLGCLVFATGSRATTVNPPEFPDLVNQSDFIVRAVVKSVVSEYARPVSPAWSIVATADFNADCHPDILFQNTVTGERYIWFMDGVTNIGGASLGIVAPVWSIVK